MKAAQAKVWLALARELGSQGERCGHPGTCSDLSKGTRGIAG
jgi:hypothetical protein